MESHACKLLLQCSHSGQFPALSDNQALDAVTSASSRISKGQGYQGFLRKGAGSSFGPKRATASYKEKLEKWTEFHYF
jgi:hypothetical protein